MAKEGEKKATKHHGAKTGTLDKNGARQKKTQVKISTLAASLTFVILFAVYAAIYLHSEKKTPNLVKLAVVTFSRNNAVQIKHLVKSVQPHADLIVVCDAQSMDHTALTAQSVGAKVIPMGSVMTGNLAQNLCLLRANSLLIKHHITHLLWMEPNDILIVHDKTFKTKNLTNAVYAPVIRFGNTHQHRQTVLLRTDTDCEFVGVNGELNCTQTPQSFDDLQILRHVDPPDPDSILKKKAVSVRDHLFLAKEFDLAENYTQAIKFYFHVAETKDQTNQYIPEKSYAHYRIGACLLALEKNDTKAHFLRAQNLDPYRLEPYYYLARLSREENDYSTCLLFTSAGMSIRYPWQNALFLEVPIYTWALQEEHAMCLSYTGRFEEARYYWQDLLNRADQIGIPEDSIARIKKNILL